MSNQRMRIAALTGSLTLTATMLLTPAVLAQDDDPTATFTDFASAFENLDLAALPTFFCADQSEALGGIGLDGLTAAMPPGFDFMLDAIDISMDIDKADVLSQSDTEAVIDVVATMTMSVDVEAMMPMLVEMMESFGATEEDIAQLQEEMMADVPEAETTTIAGQITLVPGETRPWLICSDLESLAGDLIGNMTDDSSDGMTDEGMVETA